MYLSVRDLQWAIETKKLIVDPPPEKIDPLSIDLHLDHVDEANIWDLAKYRKAQGGRGDPRPELHVGTYDYGSFSRDYLRPPPDYAKNRPSWFRSAARR